MMRNLFDLWRLNEWVSRQRKRRKIHLKNEFCDVNWSRANNEWTSENDNNLTPDTQRVTTNSFHIVNYSIFFMISYTTWSWLLYVRVQFGMKCMLEKDDESLGKQIKWVARVMWDDEFNVIEREWVSCFFLKIHYSNKININLMFAIKSSEMSYHIRGKLWTLEH